MKKYNHDKIERKWQRYWADKKIYKTKEGGKKPKCYVLDMFPYPSGEGLHVGHPRGYIATDVYSRFKRMNGFNVLHPMGFDSFGLPAENYAIKNKIHPEIAVKNNVKKFKKQLELLGPDYDWDREIITSDSEFYKWTQWIFLKMFEKGLAYESYEPINFCPSCLTGLANEDVEDGKCERCGTAVIKKPMRQWVLKITDYAERMLEDLKELKGWPEHIKEAQRNWIGRSEGAEMKFEIRSTKSETNSKSQIQNSKQFIEVFTTRIDTVFGVTYLVIAPEHSIIKNLKLKIENFDEVSKYIEEAKNKNELQRTDLAKDKTGVELKGIKVINPANGEKLPIWVADYVLADYGTGAIMAVPAHDERDFEFAKKYNLPVREVIEPLFKTVSGLDAIVKNLPMKKRETVVCIVKHWSENKYLCLKWKKHNWKTFVVGGTDGEDEVKAGLREIIEETGYTSAKFIKRLGSKVHNQFFASHKNENRWAVITPLYFELENGKKIEINQKENDTHDAIWVNYDQVLNYIFDDESDSIFWNRLIGKETSYSGDGILINSGQFNGLDSEIAREKMTKWLEEKKLGGKKINYKLKDWVFSRQRYWGEPIPLIHCENCRTKKALLIHGFEGNGNGHWFLWLKEKLESKGIKVYNPTISAANHPTVESWLKELMPIVKNFGPDDIIIGHSLGSNAALQVAQKLGKNIGHFFLLASAIGRPRSKEFWSDIEKTNLKSDIAALRKFWESKINYKKIADTISSVTVIRSEDDKLIPKDTHEKLPASFVQEEWQGYGHFDEYKELPELWEQIQKVVSDGIVPVPEKDLPVKLPKVKFYEPTDTGESPLAKIEKWVNVKCPKCKGYGKRETNTMPQWAGSSWYYLRYIDPKNKKILVDKKKEKYWMGAGLPRHTIGGVDMYVGGTEHATRHLIYARFWHKFLYDIGIVGSKEPFAGLKNQGLILGSDGRKMSKRWGNIVNPDDVVKEYGADSLRLYEMFMGPFDQMIPWDTRNIIGVKRFLERVWKLREKINPKSEIRNPKQIKNNKIQNSKLESLIHQTIKKVTEDIENFHFNTAISALMILLNEMEKENDLNVTHYELFITLLAPFAPHIAEELWFDIGGKKSIHLKDWPEFDVSKTVENSFKLVVQINGKVRDFFEVSAGISENEAKDLTLKRTNVKKWIGDKRVEKIIYVSNKIISIVTQI